MAVNGKAFLIDTTKCTACRACQVACKQWNELAAETTENRGGYENPPDFTANTWLRVQFKETERSDGSLAWTFVRSSCRHCIDAPCKQEAANSDSITIDSDTGAVLFGEGTKDESYAAIRTACPFDIPRQDSEGQLFKCRMCVDRVDNEDLEAAADRIPACAKVCTTGAITFGDYADITAAADARLAEVIAEGFTNATILDRNDVRLLILLAEPAGMYSLTTRG